MNMNSQPLIKHIGGIGDCSCACHRDPDGASGGEAEDMPCDSNATCTRPSMIVLHQMLQDHDWKGIQNAITSDSSVAMRIDDSAEEDLWFFEARRRKAVKEGIVASSTGKSDAVAFGATKDDKDEGADQELSYPQMQLRYWVGNHGSMQYADTPMRDILQKRTLLHSLCRMNFPSNDALLVQLTHGDSEGLRNFMGAVKTAQMLIDASHNCSNSWGTDGVSKGPGGYAADHGSNNCPCYIYRNYCPPVLLPPVERVQLQEPDDGEAESQTGHSERGNEMIQHTSVLTMTDAMGETPLLALTGAGSCHVDLIKVFLEACRPLDETTVEQGSMRQPSVYDLLAAKNCYGCTPVHFLAGACNR